jgi:succinoglycan biosynthesis transport protein ExoP
MNEAVPIPPQFAIEEDVKTLDDYIEALNRRRKLIAAVALTILIIAMALAMGLPSIYRSTATILIEQQEIPQDLVRSTITTFADQRIQVISQRVMTSSNLLEIIKKHNLYAAERATEPTEVVIGLMVDDVKMDMVSADVVDPRTGRPAQATIAFTLSYENESAVLAQRVLNDMVSLYLDENLRTRTEQTEDTSKFLNDEANRLKKRLNELETELAAFKEQHMENLPELQQLNLQLMQRTEQELTEIERQIAAAQERRIYLDSQLALQEPHNALVTESGERILSPSDRVRVLESQLVALRARYSPSHPDVIRTEKELSALRAEAGGGPSASEVQAKLNKARGDLAAAQERYSEDHPDVKRLRREVDNLQKDLDRAVANPAKPVPVTNPDNPAYVQLQAQIQAATTEINSLRALKEEQRGKLTDYETRLVQTPQVEKAYRDLLRDYETTQLKYQELTAKQLEAELAQQLESERKGERLTLIEPPLLPEEPAKPNRLAIAFLGFVLAIAGGLGTGAAAETMDQTVRGRKGVEDILGSPPLAIIPYIETSRDRNRKLSKKSLMLIGIIGSVVVGLFLFHVLIKPLDVTWYILLRKIGF